MPEAISALANQAIPQAQSQTSATGFNADFQTFLTLLTTQLQNQDPLNPTDTAEFTNQLVLYSQTEQQIRTNANIEKLIALSQNNGASGALGYIGNDISFIGDTIYSDGSASSHQFTMNLQETPKDLSVNILNSDGQVVASVDAERKSGNQRVAWNGLNSDGNPVEPGVYRIKISATDSQGKDIANGTRVNAPVIGVENAGDGGFLLTLAGERLVPIDSVLSVTLPTNFNNTNQQTSNS